MILEDYAVYEQKSKVFRGLSVYLIAMLVGIAFAIYNSSRWYFIVLGIIVAIISFFTAVPSFKKFFRSSPVLIISKDGVYENSGNYSLGLIKWSEIEKIGLVKFHNQDNIGIVIKDMKNYKKKLTPQQKSGLKMNRQNNQPHVSISCATTDATCPEVYGALKKFYNTYHG